MIYFKLRHVTTGDHVRVLLFVGNGHTLALAGDLIMRVGEYQVFAAALYSAANTWQPGVLSVEEVKVEEGPVS